MPGPHNVDVRGELAAHALVEGSCRRYPVLTLFITMSGIYLWIALKAERRVGLVLVLAGAITFWGLLYAIAA